MKRYQWVFITAVFTIGIFSSSESLAAVAGGTDTNADVYEVTVTKIEFQKADGTYVTLAEGSFLFDIASAAVGQSIGAVAAGVKLPSGQYSSLRFTFSRTFGITAEIANAGLGTRGFTTTGNGTTTSGGITDIGVASSGAGAATKQSILIPDGGAADTAIAAAGLTEIGATELQMSTPVSFTIDEGAAMPSIQINFNTADTIEFLDTGGGIIVLPGAPTVTVSVSS